MKMKEFGIRFVKLGCINFHGVNVLERDVYVIIKSIAYSERVCVCDNQEYILLPPKELCM